MSPPETRRQWKGRANTVPEGCQGCHAERCRLAVGLRASPQGPAVPAWARWGLPPRAAAGVTPLAVGVPECPLPQRGGSSRRRGHGPAAGGLAVALWPHACARRQRPSGEARGCRSAEERAAARWQASDRRHGLREQQRSRARSPQAEPGRRPRAVQPQPCTARGACGWQHCSPWLQGTWCQLEGRAARRARRRRGTGGP